MSRVFKFRAWDKKENKMYYNVQDTYDYMCNGKGCLEENFGDVLEDDKYIVMQYTGINDIEGNEIYEGDIVETTRELNHIIGVVVFDKGCWTIKNKENHCKLTSRFSIEVENKKLGNIYENKNLLEAENE